MSDELELDFHEAYEFLKQWRASLRRSRAKRTTKLKCKKIAALSEAIKSMRDLSGCFGPSEMLGTDDPMSDDYGPPDYCCAHCKGLLSGGPHPWCGDPDCLCTYCVKKRRAYKRREGSRVVQHRATAPDGSFVLHPEQYIAAPELCPKCGERGSFDLIPGTFQGKKDVPLYICNCDYFLKAERAP